METTPATPTTKTPEQIEKAWGNIGKLYSDTDMKLQAMSQTALKKIVLPTSVNDIIAAEKLVTELRADAVAILELRKSVTSKLDRAISHLMEPEKLITPAVKPLLDKIMSLKKQAETENAKAKYHSDEIKQIKEQIATHISNHDAKCKSKIIGLVDKAYSFALGNGDIKVEEVPNYISKLMKSDKCGENEFKINSLGWTLKYITVEELDELWENAVMESVISPTVYRGNLHSALEAKFEFYNIAVKNKVESLKQAAEEKEAAENKIKADALAAETTNKLNALATTHNAEQVTTHKELKKVYTIDMIDENWQDAVMVMTAFVSNLEKCKAELRVKNIWNLSIAQMSVALCAIKNKDEKFEFGGLKFKIIDKL